MISFTPLADIASSWQNSPGEIGKFVTEGGLFMIPLMITSFIGVSVVTYKALSLSRNRVIPTTLANKIRKLHADDPQISLDPLLTEFQRGQSTLARLGAVAARFRGKEEAEITRAVEGASREEILHLHGGIQMLDVIITVAPLLGLLGTSTGLVTIFKGLGETTDHVVVARGIAEALKSTIFGLAIAVPAIFAHSIFTRKIETLTVRLEALMAHLADILKCRSQNSPQP
jgi:biopolymer transport protein ExbB